MISTERRGDVGVIRIDRQQRRNALDTEHCEALADAVREMTAGPAAQTGDPAAAQTGGPAAADVAGGAARALVITGCGTSFCAGADLGQVYGDDFRAALYAMLHAITDVPAPVIAAVNGPAIGAGTQLAIACDLRVAADTATFAVPAARIGLAVDPWTVQRLALLAGGGATRALLLGGDTLTADQAYARGLADRLGGLDTALDWAGQIAALAPLTLAYSKRAVNAVPDPGYPDPELLAAFDACWASEDVAEGQRARAQNRPPRFRGR